MNRRKSTPTLFKSSSVLVSSQLRRNSMINKLDTIKNIQNPIFTAKNINNLNNTSNFEIINQFNSSTFENNETNNFTSIQNQLTAKHCHEFIKDNVFYLKNNKMLEIENTKQCFILENLINPINNNKNTSLYANNTNKIKNITKPTYSILRSSIIRLTPESLKCKLYCR